jgi:hypothetical protein
MKRSFKVQDKETTYDVEYIVGKFNGEPDADVLVHHKGKPFYKTHDPKKFKSIETLVLNLDIKKVKNDTIYSLVTGERVKTIGIIIGRGQWYHFFHMNKARKEFEWIVKNNGVGNDMELFELPISSYPNDKLTLEELFQEHAAITKEDLPVWLKKFESKKLKSCGMASTAQWCIQGLIDGKTIWNGVYCDD